MNKLALIDVCDVAADLHTVTIKEAKLVLPEVISCWDIFDMIDVDAGDRVKRLYADAEFWRSLPEVAGVHEGIEHLRSRDYDIHWITSPWHSCHGWESVRRAWLEEHFKCGPLDVTFTSMKYRFDGDLFIDDRPKHISEWQQWNDRHLQGKEAHLFDMNFNRHFDWARRCQWPFDGSLAVSI